MFGFVAAALMATGLQITSAPERMTIGQVATIRAEARDFRDRVDPKPTVFWRTTNAAGMKLVAMGTSAQVTALQAGTQCVIASYYHRQRFYADTACVTVTAPTTPPLAYRLSGLVEDTLGWDATRVYQFNAYVSGGTYPVESRIGNPSLTFATTDPNIRLTPMDSGRVAVVGLAPGVARVTVTYRGAAHVLELAVLRNVESTRVFARDGTSVVRFSAVGQTAQMYVVSYDARGSIIEVTPTPPDDFPFKPVRWMRPELLQPPALRKQIASTAFLRMNGGE